MFVDNFLTSRTFSAALNNTLSPPKSIIKDLPQCSILSPKLYYSDNTGLLTSNKLTKALLKKKKIGLKHAGSTFTKT